MSSLKQRKAVRYKKWSKGDVAMVEALLTRGLSYKQVAANLGITRNMVSSLVSHRIRPQATNEKQNARWRLKQLLTADYLCREAAEIVGCDVSLAHEVFDELWELSE